MKNLILTSAIVLLFGLAAFAQDGNKGIDKNQKKSTTVGYMTNKTDAKTCCKGGLKTNNENSTCNKDYKKVEVKNGRTTTTK